MIADDDDDDELNVVGGCFTDPLPIRKGFFPGLCVLGHLRWAGQVIYIPCQACHDMRGRLVIGATYVCKLGGGGLLGKNSMNSGEPWLAQRIFVVIRYASLSVPPLDHCLCMLVLVGGEKNFY